MPTHFQADQGTFLLLSFVECFDVAHYDDILSVNRGIAVEGVGGVLSGVFGLGYNTTSYSNCVGMITYTGVSYYIETT